MGFDPPINRVGLLGIDGAGEVGGEPIVEVAADGRGLALGGLMCRCFGLETEPAISATRHQTMEQSLRQAGLKADPGDAGFVWGLSLVCEGGAFSAAGLVFFLKLLCHVFWQRIQ